ncbi:DUF2971 domain-containing protein [Bacillus gobiensis]|uniref:DUF2971 domain-containing protein n=1 Tax=Bacillus gobiensis TaxID=1441095 RepID=UPI003D1EEE92
MEKDTQLLWRYMDLEKFKDLLIREELYFRRLDKFQDPFEGASTVLDYADRKRYLESIFKNSQIREGGGQLRINLNGQWVQYARVKNEKEAEDSFSLMRKFFYANCWHLSPYESEAMWKLYMKDGKGIAIQTTVERLNISLKDSDKKFMRKVRYIDYEKDRFSGEDDIAAAYFFKRNHFEHEKEYRVIIPRLFTKDNGEECVVDQIEQDSNEGIFIPIKNLRTLIQNVYVSPTSTEEFTHEVGALMERFYLLDDNGKIKKPIHSSLKRKPFY